MRHLKKIPRKRKYKQKGKKERTIRKKRIKRMVLRVVRATTTTLDMTVNKILLKSLAVRRKMTTMMMKRTLRR